VGEVIISPRAEEVIEHGDILVILGEIANCEKLR
jgi:K+/H+ antiporter YhaU regulatory subunit KhtT